MIHCFKLYTFSYFIFYYCYSFYFWLFLFIFSWFDYWFYYYFPAPISLFFRIFQFVPRMKFFRWFGFLFFLFFYFFYFIFFLCGRFFIKWIYSIIYFHSSYPNLLFLATWIFLPFPSSPHFSLFLLFLVSCSLFLYFRLIILILTFFFWPVFSCFIY